jgi:cation diffusion facilitator family transporter
LAGGCGRARAVTIEVLVTAVTSCGCQSGQQAETAAQRRVLRIALALNGTMFVVGTVAGLIGQSSSLIADALDMLADASAYAIALGAVGRSARFKAGAATLSGSLLLLLGGMVLLDVGRRALLGSEPESAVMIAVAFVSLLVNTTVLRMLGRYREGEVHLRATWIFTRVDVIANVGVMLSGLLVLLTGSRFPDLVVGGAIGVYVMKEAFEILGEAREARRAA